jgi:Eco57I restriction-modification methylase
MDTAQLKKFAPQARNLLIDQVSVKLKSVLGEASPARRENPKAVEELEKQLRSVDERELIEKIAYIWFNRFSALRFMDANGLNSLTAVSPAEGQTLPEILSEAMAGHIDTAIVPDATGKRVQALLGGAAASSDPQGEAYRLLLVAVCNHWHSAMPFMFEKIADYTELLMPSGLLAPDSVLSHLRDVMTEEACQDVEIIGWLYQFYISEKKDQVFAGLKKNQKITAENIPAATQLFTPHWIVRYLVENSLGRLWLLNRPDSKLAERMEYYIAPEEPETDFLELTRPEEIRICDPAAGSGHMLTYAFDLLYAIYEEEGYDATEIPAQILTHNLTGVEIDDRAGALAAFALAMKAAAKLGRRRFLRMEAKPDICVLQNVSFTDAEMQDVAAVVGKDLFTDELRETCAQFEQAKNFGSLIVPKLRDPAETLRVIEARDFAGDLLLKEVQARVIAVLRMAEALSPKYHVVVANPPYMGGLGMNKELAVWLEQNWEDYKSDLFSAFVVRLVEMTKQGSFLGFMTPFVWMFISSYEKLRQYLTSEAALASLVRLEYSAFESARVPICCFTIKHRKDTNQRGVFFELAEFKGAAQQSTRVLEAIRDPRKHWRYSVYSKEFQKVPGAPISFWISENMRGSFRKGVPLRDVAEPRKGMVTADNPRFIRFWREVELRKIGFGHIDRDSAKSSSAKWFPYMKGGTFRRWSGNKEAVVNWENDGAELLNMKGNGYKVGSTNHNTEFIFKPAITWTKITSSDSGFRLNGAGFLFDDASGLCALRGGADPYATLGLLNSPVTKYGLRALNPTMNLNPGNLADLPFLNESGATEVARQLEQASKSDWDAYETSWDFTTLPLLSPDHHGKTLEDSYATLRTHWQSMTDEMQRLEEENNRIFIDAYGLQDELTPEVPLNEITLTCNPAYRYGIKNDAAANETRLRADTMAEFLSYAVGCMFGRYSLDAPGLILANQGETLEDYLKRIPEPAFMPDEDNVIPVLDGDWFADDITERFRKFLRVTFGEENFADNLRFIEEALGKTIRKYFIKDFYNDHIKRYKKRPIYWMFSSPKGSFNALIYMHRYRPDTVGVVLNDYLREYIRKLEAYREQQEGIQSDPGSSASAKTKALKAIEATAKVLAELDAYEREALYPLATQRIAIDLDDGVKANYPKLGAALKPIKGLTS